MSTLAELARVLDQIAELWPRAETPLIASHGSDGLSNGIGSTPATSPSATPRHDIHDGVEPWSELIGARHVYAQYAPDQIVPDRVWNETTQAVDRLRQTVATRM